MVSKEIRLKLEILRLLSNVNLTNKMKYSHPLIKLPLSQKNFLT